MCNFCESVQRVDFLPLVVSGPRVVQAEVFNVFVGFPFQGLASQVPIDLPVFVEWGVFYLVRLSSVLGVLLLQFTTNKVLVLVVGGRAPR